MGLGVQCHLQAKSQGCISPGPRNTRPKTAPSSSELWTAKPVLLRLKGKGDAGMPHPAQLSFLVPNASQKEERAQVQPGKKGAHRANGPRSPNTQAPRLATGQCNAVHQPQQQHELAAAPGVWGEVGKLSPPGLAICHPYSTPEHAEGLVTAAALPGSSSAECPSHCAPCPPPPLQHRACRLHPLLTEGGQWLLQSGS